jgi:alpha-glucoside transport system substrate-binding protein
VERPIKPSMRWLGAFAALSIVVAACGPGADSPGTPGPGAGTPAPGDTPGMGTPAPGDTPDAGTPGPDEELGGSVSIIGSWTDAEQESFLAMLEPWRERTGVQVDYVGTREMQTQLTAAIEAGGAGLPDVAGIPGPGLMQEWFAAGALQPLDFLDQQAYMDASPPGLAELGMVDDTLAGIFFKAAVKGFIWYNTNVYDGTEPDSWEAVMSTDTGEAEALWCVAFESGGASGWPGTDWIEDIVIRQSGPDAYDAWTNGELAWTSPEIRAAFEEFGRVIETTAGGGNAIVTTAFQDGGNGLFTEPPQCLFHHQASFMSDFLTDEARAGAAPEDFDFFVMPDIDPAHQGAVTGGGDLFGMFNDTPQARSLIEYLTSAEAQEIWAGRGGFIAANTNVPAEAYADDPSRKSAETLQATTVFRFDASDQMPGAMNDAFFQAMMSFAQNPGQLDSILENLDSVQQDAYSQ